MQSQRDLHTISTARLFILQAAEAEATAQQVFDELAKTATIQSDYASQLETSREFHATCATKERHNYLVTLVGYRSRQEARARPRKMQPRRRRVSQQKPYERYGDDKQPRIEARRAARTHSAARTCATQPARRRAAHTRTAQPAHTPHSLRAAQPPPRCARLDSPHAQVAAEPDVKPSSRYPSGRDPRQPDV